MASLEDTNSTKRAEEDIGPVIEAAIVRIMKVLPYTHIHTFRRHMQSFLPNLTYPKARKTMTHQQLLAEVYVQIQSSAKVCLFVCMYVCIHMYEYMYVCIVFCGVVLPNLLLLIIEPSESEAAH